MQYGILLLIGTVTYAVLDSIGVTLLTKHLFHSQIGSLLKENVDRIAAILVWLLLSGGILIFVVSSAAVKDAGDAFSMGMIFGLIVYGVYEGTNQALLKSRNRNLVMADVAWGMLICGVVSMVLWYIARYLGLF